MNKIKKEKLIADAIAKLNDCIVYSDYDAEGAHANADEVLCHFINELGYANIVELFDKVKKWYA